MLDEYSKQCTVYKQLISNLKTNIGHAYLFNANKNIYSEAMIFAFAKSIICGKHYTNKENCNGCNICNRIDDGNYSEIIKIKPDGFNIKKEQLIDLQKRFSTKAIDGTKRVYIIYDAEKLNKSSANSILKFLEEPAEGIVALLITDNINQMMDTIVSRCQCITFGKNKISDYVEENKYKNITLTKLFSIYQTNESFDEYINNENNEEFLNNVIKFIAKYEESNIKMINNSKIYFHDKFSTKDDAYNALEIMALFYKDVIQYKINGKLELFDNYIDQIISVSKKNTDQQLINKLRTVLKIKEHIIYNANINLLIDKLVLELEGGNYYV